MTGKPLSIPSATISSLFDMQASDERLEQLARLTAAKHWHHQQEEGVGDTWTFLFRGLGRYVYVVLPIFRARYYAVVRVVGTLAVEIGRSGERFSHEDVEVRSISVLEEDALKLAIEEVRRDA